MNEFDSDTNPGHDPSTVDPLAAAFDNMVDRRTETTNVPLALQQIESGRKAARRPRLIFGSAAFVGSAAIVALVLVLTNGGNDTNVELPPATDAPAPTATSDPASLTTPTTAAPSPTVTAADATATTLEFQPTTTNTPTTIVPAGITFAAGSAEAAIQAEYDDPTGYVGRCSLRSDLSNEDLFCSEPSDRTVPGATIHDVFFLPDVGAATDFGGGFYLREIGGVWTVVDDYSLGEQFRVDNNGVVTLDNLADLTEIWRPERTPDRVVQTRRYNTIWFSLEYWDDCSATLYTANGGEVAEATQGAHSPQISPDGRLLSFVADDQASPQTGCQGAVLAVQDLDGLAGTATLDTNPITFSTTNDTQLEWTDERTLQLADAEQTQTFIVDPSGAQIQITPS